jgi:hypothetical protein
MPIPNSRLVGGVRSWPGVAVGRLSPYALPGSASVVGLLPSVLGSTSPWTWRRVHAAAYSFTAVSGSSRARPVPARGFLRPANVPGFLYGVLLLGKNPNPSERQPPSRRERRRYRLAAGIMPEGYAPLAKVARVCDVSRWRLVMPEGYAPLSKVARVCGILGDEMEALDHLWARTAQHRQGVLSIPVFGGFDALGAWAADPNRI